MRWTAAGYHHWPGAPPARDYLAAPHRHTFHFCVELAVHHDDRDVEFHDVLERVRDMTPTNTNWQASSCEAIALALLERVQAAWPARDVAVTVSEDGECGATVKS